MVVHFKKGTYILNYIVRRSYKSLLVYKSEGYRNIGHHFYHVDHIFLKEEGNSKYKRIYKKDLMGIFLDVNTFYGEIIIDLKGSINDISIKQLIEEDIITFIENISIKQYIKQKILDDNIKQELSKIMAE